MNLEFILKEKVADKMADVGLLFLRIWLFIEFGLAGFNKLSAGLAAPEWFASLKFPFPNSLLSADLNWGMAGLGEVLLAALILFGIFPRLASLGLLYVTFVAVYTVHWDLGFSGWNQIETENGLGFKVPLMLALMLIVIFTQGAGRYRFKNTLH